MAAIWKHLFIRFSEILIYLQSNVSTGFVYVYALILLAVVIFTIVQLKKQVREAKNKRKGQLKERFKKGDISKESYDAEKKELEL